MTIYEIDKTLEALINCETGEINDLEAFDQLQLERSQKIENTACYWKNLKAEADAIRAEEKALAERRKSIENKLDRIQALLDYSLQGDKFESPKCKVGYRKSTAVEVSDDFVRWAAENGADDLLTYKQPEPNKTAIKDALGSGLREIQGAWLVTRENMTIK